MQGTIEFADFTAEERKIVRGIVDRAEKMARTNGHRLDKMSLEMDLEATQAKVPLMLQELLEADDFNFAHDVFGIIRHMDRSTGELTDCFLPRSSAPPLYGQKAMLHLQSWTNLESHMVEILWETRRAYRVRFLEACRLPGNHHVDAGDVKLVPKHTVKFA